MREQIAAASTVAFTKCAEAWFPFGEERYGSRNRFQAKTRKTGAWLLEDGAVFFRIYAPDAKRALVSCEGLTVFQGGKVNILELEKSGEDFPEYRLELTADGNGFFEGKLDAEEYRGFYGPFPYTFVIDGAEIAHPYSRTTWRGGRLMNCVEIPDPDLEEQFMVKDVPHGSVTYEIFWSSARKSWSPCLVYTPPGYSGSGKTYPVIYLQHGGGENETNWFTLGNVTEIMDNLIAEGKAVPCVIVMNNTRLAPRETKEQPGVREFGAVEDLIIGDCIPFIENRYRVRTDKWGRAAAGLSMGAMQSSYLGFGNPDLFGSVGMFSGSIRCRHYWNIYDENPHLAVLREGAEVVEKSYHVIYRGVAGQEFDSRPWHREDCEYLKKLGIDRLSCYHFTIHPTMCHEWGSFRRSLYEFVQLVFWE